MSFSDSLHFQENYKIFGQQQKKRQYIEENSKLKI